MIALHVAAHPDDELLGAPAMLFALRDAGYRVVNLACGLGRPGQRTRRREELEAACARAGFELRGVEPPLELSAHDDLAVAETRAAGEVARALAELAPACVVGPSPHDRHHGHEVIGRAIRRALESAPRAPTWLAWELWATLPLPTLLVPFEEPRLEEIGAALSAHAGELTRTDYRAALEHRARLAGVLGAERVFGYGAAALDSPLAEVLCELRHDAGRWWAGAPRVLDPAAPLLGARSERRLGWWLREQSFAQRMTREGK